MTRQRIRTSDCLFETKSFVLVRSSYYYSFFALVSHSFMYDWLLHYGLYIAFAACALLFYYVFFVRFHGSLSYCIEIERER